MTDADSQSSGETTVKTINCKTCKSRTICVKPCDALTQYLSKTFKSGCNTELTIGVPTYIKDMAMWDMVPTKFKHPTYREKAILTLDGTGFPREQICKLFGINRKWLRQLLYEARKKLKE